MNRRNEMSAGDALKDCARRAVIIGGILLATVAVGHAQAQAPKPAPPPVGNTTGGQPSAGQSPQAGLIDDTIEAGEADAVPPARRLVSWNEYEGRVFSIRLGGGFLYDASTYLQDENSEQQFDLAPDDAPRDFRVLLKGKFKFKREVTWSAGLMYDGPSGDWLWRETGVMVAVPEIWGHVFVGRTKEGFSLNKAMVGYAGWTMERFTMNDASVPLLADGIKWLGYIPEKHLLWNLGFFGDVFSDGQSFSSYENQVSGRIAWLPVISESGDNLVHIGTSLRYGKVNNGELRLRSRPENFLAPYFIDTDKFKADSTNMTGLEAYWRRGSVLLGGEYIFEKADAPDAGDPLLHGGDVKVSWLITGETRGYNTRGGFFKQISPARPLFQGGPGAWEFVARFSYTDLDAGAVHGGTFWRITPMVNWYMSDHVRLALNYGYGSLDRFNVTGKTHFFQTRLQFWL